MPGFFFHPSFERDDAHPVIETEIFAEGQIALLRKNEMLHVWNDPGIQGAWENWPARMGRYERIVYNFLRSIDGFSHLIIDLRDNPGGNSTFFDTFIMPPLLTQRIYLPAYIFNLHGEYARRARNDTFLHLSLWGEVLHYAPLNPAVFAKPLPYLDPNIAFSYVFHSNYYIDPHHAPDARGQVFHSFGAFQSTFATAGTIWLLINEYSASGAEAAAAMLKYNNIATVVGTATAGLFGATGDNSTASISLPHTGIIARVDTGYFTNRYGRPFEGYGVQPHHANREGKDALATVLAMIGELSVASDYWLNLYNAY